MKPVIGVTPLFDDERNSIWMLPDYMNAIQEAGGIPVILPLTADNDSLLRAASLCTGFLLTGGQDVAPELYGERPIPECGKSNAYRDQTDQAVLRFAMERDLPLLGICRGIQLINVVLGGTLWQDLPSQTQTPLTHREPPPHDKPTHKVTLTAGSPLHGLLHAESLDVNSSHHQGVRVPAPGTTVMAKAEDNLVEALAVDGKSFIWGVQWHPERLLQTVEHARTLFTELTCRAAAV